MAIEKITDAEIVDLDYFVENDVKLTSGPGEVPKKTATKKVNPAKKKTTSNEPEVVDTHSIDSYYAAFSLPPCVIKRVTRNVQE